MPRREKAITNLQEELAAYDDDEVKPWKGLADRLDFAAFRTETGRAFENLRDYLEITLVNLANLTVPVRRKTWQWEPRGGESLYGDLVLHDFPDSAPKIRGQRGLSMKRLEQLETLRRTFLRYNRALDRTPGEPAKFGTHDRGRDSGEPCQALLDKIDRTKDQRVNQTAHLILAQALGVRLTPHAIDGATRRERDIHGEYAKIPSREPVDFIVIEDLNRYRASQGRAPSENRGLMQWAHRAVRDKLKMLAEEPFGIPVVEVAAAYTSRFCGRTGEVGARCKETGTLDNYERTSLEKKAGQKPSPGRTDLRPQYAILLAQYESIREANETAAAWNTNRDRGTPARPLRTLLLPRPGGPLFVNLREGQAVQADANAAINIGLRAIAAPGSLALLHRVRAVREGSAPDFTWRPRFSKEKDQANAREQAAYDKSSSIALHVPASAGFLKSAMPNLFFEKSPVFTVDCGTLTAGGKIFPVISGVALHSQGDGFVLDRLLEINNARLESWKLPAVPITGKCATRAAETQDEEDEIPM